MSKHNNVFSPLNYNSKQTIKLYAMEQTTKINGTKNRVNPQPKPKKKSKFTLFWEKHPNGIGVILDHEAVLQ